MENPTTPDPVEVEVVSIDPNEGYANHPPQVALRGSGFTGSVAVWFGDQPATVVVQRFTLLDVRAPMGTPGDTVDVRVVNGFGEAAVVERGFSYSLDLWDCPDPWGFYYYPHC